ncbi:MAG TPA: nitroreductase family protein [Clostridiales bacterium]|nr:nitroreductase family protein [Clostridiales bacterium]
MVFYETAWKRKSTRSFKQDDIPVGKITRLLDAARSAPSAGNRQPWHFYIIKDRQIKEKLCAAAYQQRFILDAPVSIVVCADLDRSAAKYGERGRSLYAIQDTAAAIENLLLCVTDEGLAACWCGAFDEGQVSELLNLGSLRPVAIIPIGYSASDTKKTSRRPIEEICTFVGFEDVEKP